MANKMADNVVIRCRALNCNSHRDIVFLLA